ncbi:MAG: hypothetical protein V3S14_08240 [Anaerolineae bacterium]
MPATRNSVRPLRSQLAILLLLLATTWFYAHALDFGFIWDDPLWYSRVVGKSLRELVRPMPDYHFYRPTLVLYNRLFLQADDSLAAPLLHTAQIGWHLLNVTLAYALSRRLGLGGWTAVAVGGLVACYPFSYQAVAWAAPAQPMAAALGNGALLAYVEARRKRARHRLSIGLSLLLFLAALTIQEGAVVLAVLPLLIEWVLHRRNGNKTDWWLALIYPLVAAVFGLLWLRIPRKAGYITMTLNSSVALYLLQGLIFPLIGRPGGYAPGQTIAPGILFTLAGIVLGGLLVASWRARRIRQALFGLAWAVLGIAPVVAGLRYSYVKLASRLLYYSSPGVAILWACALLPKPETRFFLKNLVSPHRLWRTAGTLVLALIALQSWLLLVSFQQTYTVGIDHLAELIQTAQTQDARLLFVNFPDRYAPKRPPYPLGYWGVTLAPVSIDLGAFPAIVAGQHPHTTSRSIPSVDFDARENSPYHIDMRGEITPPGQLYQLAHQMDAVYLSRYLPDGTFALRWAGDVTTAPSDSSCQLAAFGQTLCLQKVQADPRPGRLSLTLTWLSLSAAQPHDAVFAHVGTPHQPPIAQDDDDAWLGILPLAVWQPGDVVREQRIILLPQDATEGQYQIRIGVYNRVTGERLSATTPYGEPLLDNVFTVSQLPHQP